MRMSSSLALRLRGPLRQTELQHAMETLYVRHETLRTRFVERAGDLRQFVDAPGPLPLTVWDFRAAAIPRRNAVRVCSDKYLCHSISGSLRYGGFTCAS